MRVKIRMIEIFLSVLNNRQPLRKFYELVLLKKVHYFSKILYIESSPHVKFLKEIDAGKKMTDTKYFKILQKVRGRNLASKKCKEFLSTYKKIKNGEKTDPIFLIEDAPAWKVDISVLSPQVKVKGRG